MRTSPLRAAAATVLAAGGLALALPADASAAPTKITPTVTCAWDNGDGTRTFSVGYVSKAKTTTTIAVGPNNAVTPAPADRGQPTAFLAGNHPDVWAPTFSAADLAHGASWSVNGSRVSFTGGIAACTSKPVSVMGSTAGYVAATGAVVTAGLIVLTSSRRRRRPLARRRAPQPS